GFGVGIAARGHPAPDEVLVQRVGRRAGGKTRGIARREPVAAAVRRVHLVGENDRPLGVETKLVFGVDQNEPLPRRRFAAAGEQRERLIRNFTPLLLGQELARDDLLGAQRRIVRALFRLGRRGNDRVRQLLIVAQAVLETVAVHLARALLVHLQNRRR